MTSLRIAARPSRLLVKTASRIAMAVRQRTMSITVFPLDEPGGLLVPADVDPAVDPIAGSAVDRIVVLGDWLAIGWGVATYDLSLGGCFARGHAIRSGHSVEWSAI